ncbi:lysophospholipid acyltransferase family protein [Brevibacterium sandarakinum]|uniref:glycerol acyltransferase n=1 Tax=Brevibacterium sandarakinum TaxID=629680 RepID=UPI0012FD8D5F|nr:glycerol acyltransferase [Brevibacterium sandarakinum]
MGSDTSLGWGHRFINAAMRTLYFGRIRVLDLSGESVDRGQESADREIETDTSRARPRLIISSHRNGAIDGHQVLAAFPRAQFLISIQLIRSWFLRLFIAGIPVVRPKDVERYNLDPASVASPVEAGTAHLRRGGDLGIFPEASSEWGHRPQPYKSGAARIACTLIEEGIDLEVIPVGLFYSTPDRFRSRAEVVRGKSVTIPDRNGRDRSEWEAEVASAMGSALDEVSVDCPDEETFDRIQARALDIARRTGGGSATGGPAPFAQAFLDLQRDFSATEARNATGDLTDSTPTFPVLRWVGLVLMWLFAPVLGAAAFAGSRADGRNTVTFFRLLGGFAAVMVWVPVLIVAAFFWPLVIGIGILSAVCGWLLLGLNRFRL